MKYRIKETGVHVEIRRGVDGYKYSTKCGLFYTEKDLEALCLTLEPYVEPVKKLLAWRAGVNIFFTSDEHAKVSGMRAPEYDINYDERK